MKAPSRGTALAAILLAAAALAATLETGGASAPPLAWASKSRYRLVLDVDPRAELLRIERLDQVSVGGQVFVGCRDSQPPDFELEPDDIAARVFVQLARSAGNERRARPAGAT